PIRLFVVWLLAGWLCECAPAQTTGRISGVVTDSSGAVVADASVQAVSNATNARLRTTTDQAGNFSFFLLPPGLYRIEVLADGFKTAALEEIVVRITETAFVAIALKIGPRTETVFVRDTSTALPQADGPQLGAIVGAEEVANLPLAS